MKQFCSVVLGFAIVLAGCATSSIDSAVASANQKLEMQGSPFRYVARDSSSMTMSLLPLPVGPTKAIPPLAKQALDAIAKHEFKNGRSTANLEEVRHLKDGREVWVLNTLGDGIAYIVSFEAPSKVDSSIRIKGPNVYTK